MARGVGRCLRGLWGTDDGGQHKEKVENVTRHYAVSVAFQSSRLLLRSSSSSLSHSRPTSSAAAIFLLFQLLTVILNLGQGVWPPNLGSLTQEIPNLG